MGDHQPQPPDINVDALLAAPDGIDALFHALGRLRCSCPPDATHHLAGCSRGYGQAAATVIRRLHQDNEVLQEQLLHWRCSLGDAEDHVFVLLRENKRLREVIRFVDYRLDDVDGRTRGSPAAQSVADMRAAVRSMLNLDEEPTDG